jgi:hypothetical protein
VLQHGEIADIGGVFHIDSVAAKWCPEEISDLSRADHEVGLALGKTISPIIVEEYIDALTRRRSVLPPIASMACVRTTALSRKSSERFGPAVPSKIMMAASIVVSSRLGRAQLSPSAAPGKNRPSAATTMAQDPFKQASPKQPFYSPRVYLQIWTGLSAAS